MKVKVPSKASGITLKQFMQYNAANDDIERVVAAANVSRRLAEALSYDTVHTIKETFEQAINVSEDKFKRIVILRGHTLGFVPDLNSLTLREHVDLESYTKSIWKSEQQVDFTNLPKLLAILYRPVDIQGKQEYAIIKYDADKAKKYADALLDLTMEQVNHALAFFLTTLKELVSNSTPSTNQTMEQEEQTSSSASIE